MSEKCNFSIISDSLNELTLINGNFPFSWFSYSEARMVTNCHLLIHTKVHRTEIEMDLTQDSSSNGIQTNGTLFLFLIETENVK